MWIDLTGDGVNDAFLSDTNSDGVEDIAQADVNGDGYYETAISDANYDGVFDTVGFDTTLDGYLDSFVWDANADGVLDYMASPATGGQPVATVNASVAVVGGSPEYEGVPGLLLDLADATGSATFGTPDSDSDGYNDNSDRYPHDRDRW